MANTKVTSNVISNDINLGGNPTTTTQSAGNDTTRIATTAFVQAAINATIDSAPGALNTLNELAAAIGDDANFSTTITNSIATKLPLAGGTLTGDLGIGVTPDTLGSGYSGLQINGYAYLIGHSGGDHYITNNAYFNSGWKYGQTSTAQKIELASGRITLMTAASGSADAAITWNTGLVQDSAGLIGIGVTAPDSLLHLKIASRSTAYDADNAATWADMVVMNPSGADTSATGIAFYNNGTYHTNAASGIALVKHTASSDYGSDLAFIIRPQSSVAIEGMRLTSEGFLGLGVTDPTSPLHIASSTNRTLLLDFTGGSGGYTWASFKQSGTEKFRIFGDYTHGYLAFYNEGQSLYNLVLNDDGKVGIGVQEPLKPLHLKTGSGWATLRLDGASDSGGEIEFHAGGTKKAGMWADNSTGDLFVRAGGVNTTVKFNADGNWVGPHEDCNQRHLIGRGPFNVFDFADDWSQTYDPANNTEHSVLGSSNTNQMGVTMTYPSSATNCSKCVLTYKRTPTGSIGTVLLCNPSTSSTFNGGWGSGPFTVDRDKGYIFGYYCKRTSSASDGTHYAGFSHGVAAGTGSTVDSNPYFQAFGNSGLPQDVWTLHYYHLHPRYYTGTGDGGIGGVYRCDTGARIYGQTAWKQPTNQTTQIFRTYNYYSANSAVSIQWYAPFVYEINGHEPTVSALLPVDST